VFQATQFPTATTPRKTTLPEVVTLARDYFGIDVEAFMLHSEKDETFSVRSPAGPGYILKIASADERHDVLRFQMDALAHLAQRSLAVPIPKPVTAQDGSNLLMLEIRGEMRFVRMLTFLEGTLLHKVPRSPLQVASLGNALATIGVGLADFRPEIPKQELIWDLCHAGALRKLLPYVADVRRKGVAHVLDAFDDLAEDGMRDLPRQVIHNDFNPHNILVSPDETTTVCGVIDFGDLVHAPLVNDLAVALSYHVASGPRLDDVTTMLSAFNAVRPLSAAELACLPTLLRMRLAMTILISEWRASLFPENSSYILRNHHAAEMGLNKLSGSSDKALEDLFHQTLGIVQ
jgi:hydroxylysine kinase